LLRLHGVAPDDLAGALMGGYFGGLVNRRVLDATLDYDVMRDFGAGLGCGAIYLVTRDECPVAVAAAVMSYYDDANAGQCGSCFNGTAAMSAVLGALRVGRAERADLDRLTRWSVFLRGRGACGTLDGATNIARGLLADFPDLVAGHLAGPCPKCAATQFRAHAPFPFPAQVSA
jgi:NADH:ubiquinone oxidoreductase subunit F (NADH-binding)